MSGPDFTLTPEILLNAYAHGIFPMADSADAPELYWYDPTMRGIIPLDTRFHVPRRLKRTLAHHPYTFSLDLAFADVMRACAQRERTWINDEILSLYAELHRMGFAHSLEVWEGEPRTGELIGGLYGVGLASAFFGESMFSRRRDASKLALVHFIGLLRRCGFTLLDTQFWTAHLAQFGTIEISRAAYRKLLKEALEKQVELPKPGPLDQAYLLGVAPLQPVTHKS